MVTKTYEAPRTVVSRMTLIIDGKPRSVSFEQTTIYVGGSTGRGSQFTTSNEKVQKALESHPSFGRSYFLASVTETEDPKEEQAENETAKPEKELKKVNISNPADARDYLHENFGVDQRSVWRKADLMRKAEELGIEFVGI